MSSPFTQKHSSTNGRTLNASLFTSITSLNPNSHSVVAPGPSIQHSTRRPSPNNKPRQKFKAQSRPKAHHANTTDSRSKLKAKAESKPKANNLRIHVKPGRPDAQAKVISNTQGSHLDLKRGVNAGDVWQDRHMGQDLVGDDSEDDETEGEVEAADPDTEAEVDTNLVVDASRRPLSVDPFSVEEERIITVLSRKLEQVGYVR